MRESKRERERGQKRRQREVEQTPQKVIPPKRTHISNKMQSRYVKRRKERRELTLFPDLKASIVIDVNYERSLTVP